MVKKKILLLRRKKKAEYYFNLKLDYKNFNWFESIK